MKEKRNSTNKAKGRPKGTTISPSDRYVPLSVRIPQYLLDRINKVSKQKTQTRSQTVLEAIDDYLFEHRCLWEMER